MPAASRLASAREFLSRRVYSRRLFGVGLVSLFARGLGPLSTFATTLILARALGAEATGYFFVVLTLITGLTLIARLGLGTALQRFVGSASGCGDNARIIWLYRYALRMTSSLSVLLGAFCFVAASPIATLFFGDDSQIQLIRIMSLLIFPLSLLGIFAAFLKSLSRPVWGCFIEAGLLPLLGLTGTLLAILIAPPTIEALACVLLIAAYASLILAHRVVHRHLPSQVDPVAAPSVKVLDSCLSLTGVDLLQYALLWLPLLLLPVLAGPVEAGLYNVSHRLAAQMGLILLVFASITSHRFAAHYQRSEDEELLRLARESTRAMLMLGLPLAVILVGCARPILGLFGADFVQAEQTLYILVAGQTFNLLTGPSGYLLAMSGNERLLIRIMLATTVFMIVIATSLIPLFGNTGAAFAVTGGMIFQKSLCSLFVMRRLNLPFLILFAPAKVRN